MASSAPNKVFEGRAPLIVAISEVAGASFDLNNAWGSIVNIELTFTLGTQLTGCIVRAYASADGTNWDSIAVPTVYTETLSASAERAYAVPPLVGYKWFRASVAGTGPGNAGSSCAFNYRYLRRGSQG